MATPAFLVVSYALWINHYRRVWSKFHSKDWGRVEGKFDDGEVVTMMKGRSKTIAGYSVWLNYEYGIDPISKEPYFGLFISNKFAEKEKAEEYRKFLENRSLPVRVSPRNVEKSYVIAEDFHTDQ